MGTELRDKIMENYLAGLSERLTEFELGLARVVFIAGWDLSRVNNQPEKTDGTN